MPSLSECITNRVDVAPGRDYCAILGEAPSKGARSPLLWRAAWSRLGIEADFHPFDVDPAWFPDLVRLLSEDPLFRGGAVAVPYKEMLIDALPFVEPEARVIGAVNALYRDAAGTLCGANTDGQAAADSLCGLAGNLTGKNILQLGVGGAGKAVAAYLNARGAVLTIWNRDRAKALAFGERLDKVTVADTLEDCVSNADVIVNCTSVGFSADSSENAETPIPRHAWKIADRPGIAFDIIYQPLQTQFLRDASAAGWTCLNGLEMNLMQAALAFARAFPDVDAQRAAELMKEA